MKEIFLFFLFLTLVTIIYGQGLQYRIINKDYSEETISEAQIDSFYYDLNAIQTSKMQIHIRISLSSKKQVIDLFLKDSDNYGGILTNMTTEYTPKKVKGKKYSKSVPTQKIFEKIKLDSVKVKFVIDSLISSGQFELPTDSLISNWEFRFLHCNSVYFQYKINQQFGTKAYACPWNQEDTVSSKNIIVDNYKLIEKTFFIDSLYEEFEDKLPNGKYYSYTNGLPNVFGMNYW